MPGYSWLPAVRRPEFEPGDRVVVKKDGPGDSDWWGRTATVIRVVNRQPGVLHYLVHIVFDTSLFQCGYNSESLDYLNGPDTMEL